VCYNFNKWNYEAVHPFESIKICKFSNTSSGPVDPKLYTELVGLQNWFVEGSFENIIKYNLEQNENEIN
jgi:hypothetical protein